MQVRAKCWLLKKRSAERSLRSISGANSVWSVAVQLFCVSFVLSACGSLTMHRDAEKQLEASAHAMCLQNRGSALHVPASAFKTDGCSFWPDGTWQSCCVAHDMVYWCGGDSKLRKQADKQLRACVADSGHPLMGSVMRLGAGAGGLRILPAPWRWGYGWGWLQKMQR